MTTLLKNGMFVHVQYGGSPTIKEVVDYENSSEFHEFMDDFLEDIKDIKWDEAKVIKPRSEMTIIERVVEWFRWKWWVLYRSHHLQQGKP